MFKKCRTYRAPPCRTHASTHVDKKDVLIRNKRSHSKIVLQKSNLLIPKSFFYNENSDFQCKNSTFII